MPVKKTAKKASKKTTAKKTAAKKITVKKAAAKKAPAKKAAGKKTIRKTAKKTAAKTKKGQAYECRVCGLRVVVDEICGCVEEHILLCCEKPMAKKSSKK